MRAFTDPHVEDRHSVKLISTSDGEHIVLDTLGMEPPFGEADFNE